MVCSSVRLLLQVAVATVIFPFAHTCLIAQDSGLLLAANQASADISVVDLRTAKEIARIPEGAVTGHEIATSLDGRIAYVPIYGDALIGKPGTNGRELLAIDLASRKVVGRLDFGHGVRPHCIVMNRHNGLLYVTTELDQSVTIVDPKTFRVVGAIPTGQPQSHMLAISHDGRHGYTANVSAGTVSVLNLIDRKLEDVIKVSPEVQRISISPDDRHVFTADQSQPRLAEISTVTNTIESWIKLPASAYGTVSTADGRWLLAALPDANQVAVIDLTSRKVVRTISVPKAPHEILISPDNQTAYVACMNSGSIAVINLSDWTRTRTIGVGKIADGIAWVQIKIPAA